MCLIQRGISTKIWRLGKDVAALARVSANSFVCLRINSTLELVYKSVNRYFAIRFFSLKFFIRWILRYTFYLMCTDIFVDVDNYNRFTYQLELYTSVMYDIVLDLTILCGWLSTSYPEFWSCVSWEPIMFRECYICFMNSVIFQWFLWGINECFSWLQSSTFLLVVLH
jgi:hypothetical protein